MSHARRPNGHVPAPATCSRRFLRPWRPVSDVLVASWRRRVGHQLGDAEVEDLGVAAVGEEDVRRLEIAMDDAGRVSGGERLADIDADADDVAAGERSLGNAICQSSPATSSMTIAWTPAASRT